MIYKVITPAGNLYVNSIEKAIEYKRTYGYPYVPYEHEQYRDDE